MKSVCNRGKRRQEEEKEKEKEVKERDSLLQNDLMTHTSLGKCLSSLERLVRIF